MRLTLNEIPGGFASWENAISSARAAQGGGALSLDASGMDSMPFSALRLIDRYCGPAGADTLTGVGAELLLFLEKTGYRRRLRVRNARRRISTAGLPLAGRGGRSSVYRLSEDRALKVYRGEVSWEALEKSLENLRAAAEAGIPAAIPLEVAETDEGPGTVMEYLDGDLLADRVRACPDALDDLAARFAGVCRQLAETRLDDRRMTYTNEFYAGALDRLSGVLSAEEIAVYERAVRAVPRRNTAVHGDFHLRNLLADRSGGFRLIDLDDFGCGHPVWDVASVAMAYWLLPQKNDSDEALIRFTGLTRAEAARLYRVFTDEYFRPLAAEEKQRRVFASETYARVRYARMIGDLYGHAGGEGLSLAALREALFAAGERLDEAEKALISWE